MKDLKDQIEYWYNNPDVSPDLDIINKVLNNIKNGSIRAVNKTNGKYHINTYVKKAILLAFKHYPSKSQVYNAYDKFGLLDYEYGTSTYRKVPGAIIRDYVYIDSGAIIMPSCINIGAYIGSKTMIDMNAVVGSCAQIGKNCHISAQACIGGVLEPLVAMPVIIEDNCFIGAHSAILEGVIVEHDAIIAAGVIISASTKIIDRSTNKVYKGIIPANAVVVPGSYQSNNVNINCAIIVKYKNGNQKTSITEILRDI